MTRHNTETPTDPLDNPVLDEALGGLHRGENGEVFHSDKTVLLRDHGGFINQIREAKEDIRTGQSILWNRIAPLRYGNVEIRKNTQVWSERERCWLIADEINIAEDGEPSIRFRLKESNPTRYITLWGEDIAELIDEGLLLSKKEVDEELRDMVGLD